MIINEAASVYAKAMFDVSEEMGKTDEVLKQFSSAIKTVRGNHELFTVITSPVVKADDKKDIIQKVFEGTMEQYLINFIKILIDKNKIFLINDIFNRFSNMVDEKHTIERGIVVSAIKLGDEEISKLEESLSKKFSRIIELENKVDPSIIGGILVRVGNKEIDGTVKGKMKGLNKELSKMI